MNDRSVRTSKDVAAAYFNLNPRIRLEDLRKIMKPLSEDGRTQGRKWKPGLRNTKQEY